MATLGSVDWGYLGRGLAIAGIAAGFAVGTSYGADAAAGVDIGLAALGWVGLGVLGLLFYLGGTTTTPSDAGSFAAEPFDVDAERHLIADAAFHVDAAVLFGAFGLIAGGLFLLAF